MPFHTHQLPNGLQLICETIPSARSCGVGFFVKTGSRDETPDESGVSHFLEHMMFKGTPRRSALEVNLDFDRIGADYNAYTSEETTVYYAAVLPEYLPNAVDILADILRPSLRTEDFDTEKQVILEEIKMYEDSPTSVLWDHAKKLHFADHPLGNTILGTMESVGALTRDQMQAYYDRRYAASNIVVAAAGNIDWPRFVDLIGSTCGTWPGGNGGGRQLSETSGKGGMHVVTKDGTAQEHVLLMAGGPAAEDPLRYAASVLAVAVGDGSGSRLYWELVDTGRAESASCGNDHAQGCGLTVTSYSCDPEATAENLASVQAILEDVRKNGITAAELEQAKNKIASRVVRANERPMKRMGAIARSWLYLNEFTDPDTELARFDAVDFRAIGQYLDRYPIDRVTTVAYGPLAKL